ncbi:selenocysteine insertion sequence-binding protein 2-like [Lampris incognitus]|uniref:selenocysteine insertion sequence-binding protein 2-like n=1 Tax=Lampris incognitus TaxID=2546036 RepID=UPI0024B5B893|nr:selenocysteine insertion sequence-binding protein 2-like [Lampris incognitus]
MDKESKLSPAAQPFVSKPQRQEKMEHGELTTASSPPLRVPNLHVGDQSSRGLALPSPKQRPLTADGVPTGRRGDIATKHGYSNSRHERQTTNGITYPRRERSLGDSQMRTSKQNSNPLSHSKDKITGLKFVDMPKRGFRGARSAPNFVGRSKSAQAEPVKFEVKMSDFPELAVVAPCNTAASVQAKAFWGPPPQSQSLEVQRPVSAEKTLPARKGTTSKPDSHQHACDASPVSFGIPPGQPPGASSLTVGSGSVVTSWANVASQPPKQPVPKEKTIINTSTKEETSAPQEEGTSDKKKRRKKKKKPKNAGEDADGQPDEPTIQQEPPKFEDEEEFPNLALALAGAPRLPTSSNIGKLCNEENQREGSQPQSGDQNKEKASIAKPLPTETSKIGQKAEKASGKKSKVPVQLDIGDMLAVLEKKQQSQKAKQDAKPVILSVGGALPVGHKQLPVQKKLPWQQEKIAHNPLDSTSPLVKKGKQREVPKAKKPTPLKRVILKEREERKRNRLLEERGLLPEKDSEPADDPVALEQCQPSATDEISSPTGNTEEQPEGHVMIQMEREGDGERDVNREKPGEREIIQAPPCPPSRPKIHSRKFRDYCSQVLSKDVDECATALLKELVRFQDRLYQKDPMKARMKRRLVMGLREVLKHLKLRKVKCVVISPNCERIKAKGGLDEALHTIIDTCREQGVPFVFALSRKALGRCVNKAVPVSLVGIFNYDGAQDHYHKMIELSSEARRAYEVMVENLEQADHEESPNELQPSTEEQPCPDATQPEEPEYIKLWKKMLEKDSNHKFLNFEEQLRAMHLVTDSQQFDVDEGS